MKPVGGESIKRSQEMAGPSSCTDAGGRAVDENGAVDDEEAPLLTTAECRICQEEDSVDTLETPCSCNGSLKYAHRKCVQHWCNEKGDITCEICHQAYQPGYTAPPPCPRLEETTIDIGGGWQISGTSMDLNDPRFFTIAEVERQFLEGEYEDYNNASNANGPAFFRSTVLILMALLLLRHAVTMPESEGDGDEDESFAFYILFLLRVVGFLLPCYIMAWAISILNRRRQRQETVAMAASQMAASQIAYVLQAGHRRGLHFAFASPPPPPASAQPPAAAVTPAVAPQEDIV